MQIVTHPKIEILGLTEGIPFESEIDAIYRGYRQCYTKDPMAPMSEMDLQSKLEMMSSIGGYLSYHKQLNLNLAGQDPDRMFTHLRKCEFIMRHANHQSPLEHSKLTVRISNLSRSASHQLVRHRLASYSQQSQRYVTEKDFIFTLPAALRNNESVYQKVSQHLQEVESLSKELKAMGVANEDIRAIFPNATCTEIIMTANFRQWMHIFEERCCSCAQAEIRNAMTQILTYLQEHIPLVFDHAGAKCERLGYCPESEKTTCGKHILKDELFNQMKLKRIHGKTWVADRDPTVPLPTAVNSLDFDRMSACERYHAGFDEAPQPTLEPEMSFTFNLEGNSYPLNEATTDASVARKREYREYGSPQLSVNSTHVELDETGWNTLETLN